MISVGATYNWSTFSCTESYPIGDLTVDKVIILDTTGPGFYQADHTQHINGDNKNAYLQYMHSLQHCPTQQIWQIIYQVIKGKLLSNLWSPRPANQPISVLVIFDQSLWSSHAPYRAVSMTNLMLIFSVLNWSYNQPCMAHSFSAVIIKI